MSKIRYTKFGYQCYRLNRISVQPNLFVVQLILRLRQLVDNIIIINIKRLIKNHNTNFSTHETIIRSNKQRNSKGFE